ncbi:MAG: hypothetical protein PHH68_07375 [Candidatus Omnitrophica bacterium]|jgi:hypothetical protein|nr:hypothetical protein [Candidatus Omnitrophota bacterium]MDD5080118.1 hypothetical protein [Candidatus Omnitrophota bacterium]
MKRMLGLLICFIGVLLPWRARVIFSELLGWIAQAMTGAYFLLAKFIIKSLSGSKAGVRL